MRELNPLLHAQYVPCGNLLSAVPLAWGRSFLPVVARIQGRILPHAPKSGKCSGIFTGQAAGAKSAPACSVRTLRKSATSCASCVGEKFYPSGCGGHKNSESAATFSEFLGRRKNFSPTPAPVRGREEKPRLRAGTDGKTSAPSAFTTQPVRWDTACLRRNVRTKPAVYGRLFAFF